VVCGRGEVLASACAVARAFPVYSRKTHGHKKQTISVGFVTVGSDASPLTDGEVECLNVICEGGPCATKNDNTLNVILTLGLCLAEHLGIHLTQEVVDAPTNEMHTDAFVEVSGESWCALLYHVMVIVHSLQKVREIGRKLGIQPEVIQGTDLQDKGFGGMWILWTENTILH